MTDYDRKILAYEIYYVEEQLEDMEKIVKMQNERIVGLRKKFDSLKNALMPTVKNNGNGK